MNGKSVKRVRFMGLDLNITMYLIRVRLSFPVKVDSNLSYYFDLS